MSGCMCYRPDGAYYIAARIGTGGKEHGKQAGRLEAVNESKIVLFSPLSPENPFHEDPALLKVCCVCGTEC